MAALFLGGTNMKCPKCNAENPGTDRACIKCGQSLSKPVLSEESGLSYEWRPLAFVIVLLFIIVTIKNLFFK
jgi:predicted amidophosphoribosyltransferase